MIPTPAQTVGPFFGFALPFPGDSDLVGPDHPDAIRLHGRVLDGDGQPVPDALLELTQPAEGSRGWGRCATDDDGHYTFTTVEPSGPFFALTLFARGLGHHLFTRAYPPQHVDPPFLADLDPERRDTLRADADDGGYRFDLRLQGAGETVFLTYPRH